LGAGLCYEPDSSHVNSGLRGDVCRMSRPCNLSLSTQSHMDMVCIAVIHAFERGRRAAWAVSDQLSVPVLVEQVAMRSAVASFWEALADFAATTKVPSCMRTAALTHQPFLSWHVVLVRGSGLRVVRR
jgi:hypothetical protein